MADDVKIELDPKLEAELHTVSLVKKSAEEVATAIAEKARGSAPVDSGAYAASIRVNPPNAKGVAQVVADDPRGWIEFGSTTHDGHYTLRNAVMALGLKFKKGK